MVVKKSLQIEKTQKGPVGGQRTVSLTDADEPRGPCEREGGQEKTQDATCKVSMVSIRKIETIRVGAGGERVQNLNGLFLQDGRFGGWMCSHMPTVNTKEADAERQGDAEPEFRPVISALRRVSEGEASLRYFVSATFQKDLKCSTELKPEKQLYLIVIMTAVERIPKCDEPAHVFAFLNNFLKLVMELWKRATWFNFVIVFTSQFLPDYAILRVANGKKRKSSCANLLFSWYCTKEE